MFLFGRSIKMVGMICPTQLEATPQSLEALTNLCIPSNFFCFLASVQLLNGISTNKGKLSYSDRCRRVRDCSALYDCAIQNTSPKDGMTVSR